MRNGGNYMEERLGTYTLRWPPGVFPLGGDSLALGRWAKVRAGWRVCDLGTGSGVLLLLLAERAQNLTLRGVELDEYAVQTAQENLTRNGLDGVVLPGDLRQPPFPAGSFDLVISNPPYFPRNAGKSGGPTRCEERCTLEEVCASAGRLLCNGGRFALCHRPERLADVFAAMRGAGIEPKRLKLLARSPAHPPSCVLLEGVRQGRPGLTVEPQLFA